MSARANTAAAATPRGTPNALERSWVIVCRGVAVSTRSGAPTVPRLAQTSTPSARSRCRLTPDTGSPQTAPRGDAPARYACTFGDIPGLRRVRPSGPSVRHVDHLIGRLARGSLATAVFDQQHVGRRRDKTVAMTSTGSHFKRWVFSRHSHPWSAWTRWASTPLVLLPVWNRSARQGVVVRGSWPALQSRPLPTTSPDDSAFATRAVLGEERWLEERPVSGALAINCMADAALLIAIDSARRHRRWQMTIATIGTMSALLWYWREMARYRERGVTANSRPLPDATTSGGNAGRPSAGRPR